MDLRVLRKGGRSAESQRKTTPWPLRIKIDVDFDGESIQTWDQVGNIHCTLRKSNIKYLYKYVLKYMFSAIKFLMLQVFLTTANLHSADSYSSIFPHQTIVRSLRTPPAKIEMVTS